MEDRLKKYMTEALKEAELAASEGDIPVGAVVVWKDQVIGRGRNKRRLHHDPTAHAEIVAIREAGEFLKSWNLSDCELYVTLEPCPMCAGAIVQSRIRRLVYGCADPKAGASGTLYDITSDTRLNHRCETLSGVEENRCKKILQDFFILCRSKRTKKSPS
ncbi:tRNA(adenine34) deaminase [Dethiosulfovibrio salsuginis]|uniref:tRNA-specific adenosine deaminase n=1 Tax=Dethiosulfovibrio salsuginis TaxID=561720 RepID=A0A1X7JJR1_9BACT|nr:tRNA(adenine34) deaminase [Dethiosulfovibrio salsuginis]